MARPLKGRQLGPYQLLIKIAAGGMAEILLARLVGKGGFTKLVAIKRMLAPLADDERLVEMLLREARLAARISSPNVCQTFALDEHDGEYFLVMEYLEGVSMSRLTRGLAAPGAGMELRLLVALVGQACEGLHHAHELCDHDGSPIGIIHRDVTPNNLFVTLDGLVKVLDFGVARPQQGVTRTGTGALIGTYPYMSPEQIEGEPMDRRADLFALGAILFEGATGLGLFHRDTEFRVLQAISRDPIPRAREYRPDLPAALDDAIARALARDRRDRFATARELGEALSAAIAPFGGPLPARAIAEEIQSRFGDEIEARRAIVADAIAQADAAGEQRGEDTVALEVPLAPWGPAPEDGAFGSVVSVAGGHRSARSGPPSAHTGPRARQRRLVATAAVAALTGGAVALGAVALWGDRTGGELTGPTAMAAPPTIAADPPESSPSAGPETDSALAVPVARDGGTVAGRAERPARRRTGRQDRLATPAGADQRPGFVTIDSTPYATIYIDGKKVGDTPLYRVALPPGRHEARADCSCGRSRGFTMTVVAGVSAPVRRLVW